MISWTAKEFFGHLLHRRAKSTNVSSLISGMSRSSPARGQWSWSRVVDHLERSLAARDQTATARAALEMETMVARAIIDALYQISFQPEGRAAICRELYLGINCNETWTTKR